MQFDSLTFATFFAAVVALYYLLPSWAARKTLLVAASYLFYAAWNPFYVALLWISTLADWLLAKRIAAAHAQFKRRALLGASLAVNLGLLGYFKYGEFLLANFQELASRAGWDYAPPDFSIVLPIGISFYTFQTLSYTLDVYRGKLAPQASLLDFSLFVAFFPQLVAGPIVRARSFLPQCTEPKPLQANAIGWGLTLVIFGLFAKVVLSDTVLAPVADAVFESPDQVGTFEAWLGVLAFSGQIFFDFSGYSICAIGAALALGFALPENFRSPYAAIGFSDFWRRWHITLSEWLRDYLYVSLGGNRSGLARTFVNLVITMFLGGLWHGASWMFVIWGLLHGAYLVIERAIITLAGTMSVESALLRFLLAMFTTWVVSVTWVFFRAEDLPTALLLLEKMFSPQSTVSLAFAEQLPGVAFVLASLIAWHWLTRETTLEELFKRWPKVLRVAVIAGAILGVVFASGGTERAFIYFQF